MQKKTRIILYVVIGILSGIGIAAGSIFDLPISRTLFVDNSFGTRLIALLVCLIFYGSCVFFLGMLLSQFLAEPRKEPLKPLFVTLFIYLFLSTAVLAGAEFINDPAFGTQKATLSGSLITGTMLYAPFFILGYLRNKKRYDKAEVKRLIKMIAVITASFLMVKYLNTMVLRPSYSSALGNGFVNWYGVSRSERFLMSFNDLISYSSGSFVCGPAEYSILFLVIFPTYSIAFPKLKDKGLFLTMAAAILFVLVSVSRLISGANYLSDIAFATFAGVKLCLSCEGIKLIRRKKDTVYS